MAEEIEMPPRAAEFAISGELEADLLLLFDGFFDLAVFDRFQRRAVDFAFGEFGAGIFQDGGPQQATDMIGAERRCSALGHFFGLPKCRRINFGFAFLSLP
jgi:hypothetical protein